MTKYPAAKPIPVPPLSAAARERAEKAYNEFKKFAAPKEELTNTEKEPGQLACETFENQGQGGPWTEQSPETKIAWAAVEVAIRNDERSACEDIAWDEAESEGTAHDCAQTIARNIHSRK